jgi:hypothetical protein
MHEDLAVPDLTAGAVQRILGFAEVRRHVVETGPESKERSKDNVTGGEAGIRTLRPRLSNLVMARDFWF